MSRELNKVDARARDIIEQHLKTVPVKLGSLARALGVADIKIASMSPGVSGQITREDNRYIIRINRNEARERQRFTLAHEIAHYLLHRHVIDSYPDGITDNVLYRSGAPEKIEYEANRLAADLVMPISIVEDKIRSFGGIVNEAAIERMAEIFDVSKAAMEIRLSTFAEA